MNLSFKHVVAFGILSLVNGDGLCPGDHQRLKHAVEFNVRITCDNKDIHADNYLSLDFLANAGIYANMTNVGTWCIDVDRRVICDGTFGVDTYSSYDNPNIPPGAVDLPQNLDRLNYLINIHPTGSDVDIPDCYRGELGWQEYQSAVWEIVDGPGRAEDVGAEACVVNWLVNDSAEHGDDFVVECHLHERIGVVLVIDDDTGYITNQVLMAEIELDDIDAICSCGGTVTGDPHYKTWGGELYDFHGVCDLTLLKNPHFNDGVGMDINVRSKQLKQFSYISSAVVRIGNETFEAAGRKGDDTYWLNGEQGPIGGVLGEGASIAGYPITFVQVHKNQRDYVIHISEGETIKIVVWKDFVRVDVVGTKSFSGSTGLMGSFDQEGAKLGRDGVTLFDDVDEFGMDWQVPASEAHLFHKVEGPQHPERCSMPAKALLKRRLAESTITLAEAEIACSRVSKQDKDMCVFDVMATNDLDVAGAY